MSVISVNNLKKYFGETKAVDGISLEVNEGEIMGFLGPNAAGKTTTIRCMMDFLRPNGGDIKILGLDAQSDSQKLKHNIGFLSEEDNLYNSWNGRDHINLVKKIRALKTQEDNLITRLKFDPRKKVKNLSSGNKQKLRLILALMHKPKVLILDEPTAGLDPLLQYTIYDILRSEARGGTSIFMSSHNLAEVERICDRACIIKNGKIIATESIHELKNKRLYTVHVYFEKKVAKDILISEGVKVTKEFEDGFILSVKGNITPLLYKLNQYKPKDLEITRANLEDIFIAHYK